MQLCRARTAAPFCGTLFSHTSDSRSEVTSLRLHLQQHQWQALLTLQLFHSSSSPCKASEPPPSPLLSLACCCVLPSLSVVVAEDRAGQAACMQASVTPASVMQSAAGCMHRSSSCPAQSGSSVTASLTNGALARPARLLRKHTHLFHFPCLSLSLLSTPPRSYSSFEASTCCSLRHRKRGMVIHRETLSL